MLRKSVILLILVISIYACDHDTEEPYTKKSLQTEFLMLDKFGQEVAEFTVGEEITLELIVTNTENFAVDYSVTLPGYDIDISQGDTPVWSANFGTSSAQVVSNKSIGAQDKQVITEKWNGVNNNGDVVPPGEYTITPRIVYFIKDEAIKVPSSQNIVLN